MDSAALRPHLKPAYLKQKTVLYEVGDTIPSIYFPTNAVVSYRNACNRGNDRIRDGREGWSHWYSVRFGWKDRIEPSDRSIERRCILLRSSGFQADCDAVAEPDFNGNAA